MTDPGFIDRWREEIAAARAGSPCDWGDQGPGPDELEVLLDAIVMVHMEEDVEVRLAALD